MWLYVPTPSSNFVQAWAASASASGSLNPAVAASLTSNAKPMRPASLSRAWRRAGWIRGLSGLILPPSTLERGAAQWIASYQAIPASQTASQAAISAMKMTASLSSRQSGSSISAGLLVSSGRTSQGIWRASSQPLSRFWSDWAVALRLESFRRQRPGPAIDASDCSSWQTGTWTTPCVDDSMRTRVARYAQGGTSLTMQVELQALAMGTTWSTPIARDHKDGTTTLENTPINGILGRQVLVFHCSHPGLATPAGLTSSSERRRLNPLFVEWLMGLPFGWTGFAPVATPASLWLQRMRGALSTLCSTRIERQPALLL